MTSTLTKAMVTGGADPSPRFSLDPSVRHLNHGSFGAVPQAVQQEQQRLRALIEWNPVRWFASLPPRIAAAREEMAQLLDVRPNQLAFVLNASAGASAIYQSYSGREPVDVLVTDHGYGAVSMGAKRLAERTGGSFHTVAIPLAATAAQVCELVRDALQTLRPRLLVIDQITSSTAREFPAAEICDYAREIGTTTLVDGAHAPGTLANPVCKEADYWVANLHKFACAPRGTAVLYARDGGSGLFPIIDSWGAELDFPQRFDHTGTLDTTGWLVAPFAWRHIESTIGWHAWRSRCSELIEAGTRVVATAMSANGAPTGAVNVGQPVATMSLVALPPGLGTDHDSADSLRVPFSDATGIAAAFTHFNNRGYLRLSAHAYNSLADYEYLAKVGVPLLKQWAGALPPPTPTAQ